MTERSLLVESELDTLFLVSQLLNSTHDLRSKLKGILEILHKRSGLRFGMITLRDVDDDSMSLCEF